MSKNIYNMSGDMKVMKDEFVGLGATVQDLDKHIYDMYKLMSDDLDSMRASIEVMAPSIAAMGNDMNVMKHDMNRGIKSFTSPMNYMKGMID